MTYQTLKQKSISGLLWSFIDNFAIQGIRFVVGIVLARILSPREFGLIAMITIFIAISKSVINSGFSGALIRKEKCTLEDYSTVFYYNLVTGIIFFILLFLTAPAISNFFNEPILKLIVQIISLVLIIDSFTIIQRTILIKRLDFKLQAKISVIASIGSGGIAIIFALLDYGIWSLVALQLSQGIINSCLLWLWNGWKPVWVFSQNSFWELFGFGSKLMISGLIATIYNNVYYIVIGKYYSTMELGYYTRAEQFSNLPSQNLNSVIGRVSFPLLSSMQGDIPLLRASFQKLLRSTMYITFVLMLGLAAVAEPMILSLVGEKWLNSVIYLQMLCFVGMFYPLHALNLTLLNVMGRSDLFLKLEVIKRTLAIPAIVLGVFFGIKIMIAGMLVNNLIAFYLNSYWTGKMIKYSKKQQLSDILPSFILSLLMGAGVYGLGLLLPFSLLVNLFIQILTGALLIITISEIKNFRDYEYIKTVIFENVISLNKI